MSSEIHLSALAPALAELGITPADLDPVLHTAGDRPNTDTMPVLIDPAADHVDADLKARREDVEEKHRRVARFLQENEYDGLVLGRADSLGWFTSGGDLSSELASDAASVHVYVTRHSRAVVADNVQSARVFEEELAGLGFQLKERPWDGAPERTIEQLAHGKRIAADTAGLCGWPCEVERLRSLRLALTKRDRQALRELGRTLTLTIEATCRNFQPGETEADVAGHLAHRLVREGVVPLELRVAGDDRLERFREPGFKAAEIHRRAVIAATGRRHGLCASATRTVSFGHPEAAFRQAHELAAMVDATYIFFSRPGESVSEVFRRARRIYEKFGRPHEWTLDYQGFLTAHAPREVLLRPESGAVLQPHSAVRWSPSVGPARSEDTTIIAPQGYEVVTGAQQWPKLEIMVKGFAVERPAVLER